MVPIDKFILKFIWKVTSPRIAKITFKMKNTVGGISLPDFKVCHVATAIYDVFDVIDIEINRTE